MINLEDRIIRPRHSGLDGIASEGEVDWGTERWVLIQVETTPVREIQIHPGHQIWINRTSSRRVPTALRLHIEGEIALEKDDLFVTSKERRLSRPLISGLSVDICKALKIGYFDLDGYYYPECSIIVTPE